MNDDKNVKWNDRNESTPENGSRILLAWIQDGEIKEVVLITCFRTWACVERRFNYWCLPCFLPSPPKRDYCRESWEKFPPFNNIGIAPKDRLRGLPMNGGTVGVTIDFYREIWNAAISAAIEHGLDKV